MLVKTKRSDLPRRQSVDFMGDEYMAVGKTLVMHIHNDYQPSLLEKVIVVTPDDMTCEVPMNLDGSIGKMKIAIRPGEYARRKALFGSTGVEIPGERASYLGLPIHEPA